MSNTLTADMLPPDALVEWVMLHCVYLAVRIPKDRPWWYSSRAPSRAGGKSYLTCRCGRLTEMRMHAARDHMPIWLAQCERCERIIWTCET